MAPNYPSSQNLKGLGLKFPRLLIPAFRMARVQRMDDGEQDRLIGLQVGSRIGSGGRLSLSGHAVQFSEASVEF